MFIKSISPPFLPPFSLSSLCATAVVIAIQRYQVVLLGSVMHGDEGGGQPPLAELGQ